MKKILLFIITFTLLLTFVPYIPSLQASSSQGLGFDYMKIHDNKIIHVDTDGSETLFYDLNSFVNEHSNSISTFRSNPDEQSLYVGFDDGHILKINNTGTLEWTYQGDINLVMNIRYNNLLNHLVVEYQSTIENEIYYQSDEIGSTALLDFNGEVVTTETPTESTEFVRYNTDGTNTIKIMEGFVYFINEQGSFISDKTIDITESSYNSFFNPLSYGDQHRNLYQINADEFITYYSSTTVDLYNSVTDSYDYNATINTASINEYYIIDQRAVSMLYNSSRMHTLIYTTQSLKETVEDGYHHNAKRLNLNDLVDDKHYPITIQIDNNIVAYSPANGDAFIFSYANNTFTATEQTNLPKDIQFIAEAIEGNISENYILSFHNNTDIAYTTNDNIEIPEVSATDQYGNLYHAEISHDVNEDELGTYTVSYQVNDFNGTAHQDSLNLSINEFQYDTPTISLNGDSPLMLYTGDTLNDPGASASDIHGNQYEVTATDNVNTDEVGTYVITYSVQDYDGITHTVDREVIVQLRYDTPSLTLNGNDGITLYTGDTYTELGAEAIDSYGNSYDVTITGDVDTNEPGTYMITYSVTDYDDIIHTIERKVIVELLYGTPTISLDGDSTVFLNLGEIYNEPGASASDIYGNLYDVYISGSVNTNEVGLYLITYSVTDYDENTHEIYREVFVQSDSAPTFDGPTHIIKNADYIAASDFYLDFINASDEDNNDLTDAIEVIKNDYTGNANVPGNYEMIFRVTDQHGTTTRHTMMITVQKSILPLIIIDNTTMILSDSTELSDADFIDTLKRINAIPNETFVFTDTHDTYSHSYDIPGNYDKAFDLLSESGTDYSFTLGLQVIEDDTTLVEATPGYFASTLSIITTWWPAIVVLVLVIYGLKRR